MQKHVIYISTQQVKDIESDIWETSFLSSIFQFKIKSWYIITFEALAG